MARRDLVEHILKQADLVIEPHRPRRRTITDDWVIVGGESGPGARPMRPEWVRSIRDQCREAGVAFFFKQWGGTRKKLTGRELDGRVHDEFPAAAEAVPPSLTERRRRMGVLQQEIVRLAG